MGFSDWLLGATPGQQIGQAAREAISGAIDSVGKIIDDLHTSDEEKAAAKLQLKQLQLQMVEVQISDLQNARSMQVATKSFMPGFMSIMSVIGFFGGFLSLLWWGLPNVDEMTKTIINMFAGAMITAYADSRNFWLGSTNGSQNKDILLHQSAPVKNG